MREVEGLDTSLVTGADSCQLRRKEPRADEGDQGRFALCGDRAHACRGDPGDRRKCTVAPYNGPPKHVSYPAGSTMTRSSNLAYRFPKAANVGAMTAPTSTFWLSARSGFSSSVWSRWVFSSPGGLCGDTDAPGASKRIFAGH
jgi:hypothetical protein